MTTGQGAELVTVCTARRRLGLADLLASARAARAEVVPGPPTAPHYHYAFPHGSECTDWRCSAWVVEGLGPGWCMPGRHVEGCPMAGPA